MVRDNIPSPAPSRRVTHKLLRAVFVVLVLGSPILTAAQEPAADGLTLDHVAGGKLKAGNAVTFAATAKKLLPKEPVVDFSIKRGTNGGNDGFRWRSAVGQSLLFLGVQHGFALATQAKTRRALRGPFFKDYFRSVKSIHGWSDGGRFFTNYVAHPMEGSFLGFVQIQNDPKGMKETFSMSRSYWKSRGKAALWAAAWSTQFEIGPISQASIGNIGLHGKQTWVDIVMTPTAGLGLLVGEDILDKYVIRRIEARSGNAWVRRFVRMLLNPTRTNANLVAFKKPWYREPALR